jgi:hypothetical protein
MDMAKDMHAGARSSVWALTNVKEPHLSSERCNIIAFLSNKLMRRLPVCHSVFFEICHQHVVPLQMQLQIALKWVLCTNHEQSITHAHMVAGEHGVVPD